MNDPLMPVMQMKIDALERQVAKLSKENERVRNLLTEFDHRHDADLARAEAAEAALVAAYRLALGDAAKYLRKSTPADAAPDSLLRWALSDRAVALRSLPTPTAEELMARIKEGLTDG